MSWNYSSSEYEVMYLTLDKDIFANFVFKMHTHYAEQLAMYVDVCALLILSIHIPFFLAGTEPCVHEHKHNHVYVLPTHVSECLCTTICMY